MPMMGPLFENAKTCELLGKLAFNHTYAPISSPDVQKAPGGQFAVLTAIFCCVEVKYTPIIKSESVTYLPIFPIEMFDMPIRLDVPCAAKIQTGIANNIQALKGDNFIA